MQAISEEMARLLSQRMKLGEFARPVCRVEVDRLAFVPGRTEEISFIVADTASTSTYMQQSSATGETKASGKAFVFPAVGYTMANLTSKFGMRTHPLTKKQKLHAGIDIGCPTGTDIVAPWSGTVTRVADQGGTGYGQWIEIKHEEGYRTRYGHLSKRLVKEGQLVQQGDVIAKSGATGGVTGPHLHFEMRKPGNGNDTTPFDPKPYMDGTQKLYAAATMTGTDVVVEKTYEGYPGELIFDEQFKFPNWYSMNKKITNIDAEFRDSIKQHYGPPGGYQIAFELFTWKATNYSKGFSFTVDNPKPKLLSLSLSGNAGLKGIAYVQVMCGGKQIVKFQDWQDYDTTVIKDVVIPEGKQDIRISVVANTKDTPTNVQMNFDQIQVHVLEDKPQGDQAAKVTGDYETTNVTDFLTNNKVRKASIEVGKFVYMDTLVLDSVSQMDLDDQFEMDAREARIVISNPNGYYSPDNNPFYFPETYQPTPYNYFINGYHYGVLTENTPIRIFMGYGKELMRVFTGLIDKVDIENETPQITITARDMYKKILTKVLSVDKSYPEDSIHLEEISITDPTGTTNTALKTEFTRKEEIIAKAKKYASEANPALDFKFLCAISHAETAYGTTGLGVDAKGSFILGYGAFDSGPQNEYRGINKQLYFGAKRYNEAMKSRNWKIRSLDDVTYFWKGGDKGAYQWATDQNWPSKVWRIYEGYLTNPPPDLASTPMWTEASSPATALAIAAPIAGATVEPAAITGGTPWLKSAIVTDLVVYAGMTQWRQAPSDLGYPDFIIEETYLIEKNDKSGKIIAAVPDSEGEFEEKDYESILTPNGWLNPFVDQARKWSSFQVMVNDCIKEVLEDTNYRIYADRYGTIRSEQINYKKPVVESFTEFDNLISLSKTIDFTRARSHVVIRDENDGYAHFLDTEILMELKGELRSTLIAAPYAKTYEAKAEVARKFFDDMKRLCRTLQVSIPGNPALDVLDRIYISDSRTTTRSVYTIKGIKSSFSPENGYIQVIDLMWNGEGAQI